MEQTTGDISLTPTTPRGKYRWYLIASIILSSISLIGNIVYQFPISLNKTIFLIIFITNIAVVLLLWTFVNVGIFLWVLIKKFEGKTLLLPGLYILTALYPFSGLPSIVEGLFSGNGKVFISYLSTFIPVIIPLGTSIYLISKKRLSNEPWPQEKEEENKSKRPSIVGVICILEFFTTIIGFVVALANLFSNGQSLPPMTMLSPLESIYILIMSIPAIVSLVLIWKMKKKGLILFIVLQAIGFIFMLLVKSLHISSSVLLEIVFTGFLVAYYKRMS